MAASWDGNTNGTGCVVDIGEEKTSITPIQDMVVIPFAIKSIPIDGKEVTQFIIEEESLFLLMIYTLLQFKSKKGIALL